MFAANFMNQHDNTTHNTENEQDNTEKIQALREMISNAERTILEAKAMLFQLEGHKHSNRRPRNEDIADGTVVEGKFDGQVMIGFDGKQYPVPANYASKSKLVEGDTLKLTISPNGSFVYKQIGPVDRKHALGIVSQDENGNYYILSEGHPYKVLLASVTYFKAAPGDEVAIILPRDFAATWASIENILQKNTGGYMPAMQPIATQSASIQQESHEETPSEEGTQDEKQALVDEWIKDLEDLEQEASKNSEK